MQPCVQELQDDACSCNVAGETTAHWLSRVRGVHVHDAIGCHIGPDVKCKLTGLRGALFLGSKEDNDGNGGLIRDRYDVLRQQFAGMVQAWVAKKLANVTFYEFFRCQIL